MAFEDELRRVVDQVAEHIRHEAAGRLQAAMPELYEVSQAEQRAAIDGALGRAREEAERDFNERIEAVKREASEQVEAAHREAAEKVAASEQHAASQLEAARREHTEGIQIVQREAAEQLAEQLAARERETAEQLAHRERETAEQLAARERETAEQLANRERETAEQLSAKDREAAERLSEKEREAAERLEAREREITEQLSAKTREVEERLEAREREIGELLETKNREAAERVEAVERQAMERAEAASREAAERLGLVESTLSAQLVTATAEAEARAREAGRSEGRKEGRDTLAECVSIFGKAGTLSEVLDALGKAAEREVPSVAVVLVQGGHVRTWRLAGFGHQPEQSDALTVALPDAGLIRHAIESGRIARGHTSNAEDLPSFAAFSTEEGRAVAAFPLVVGGTTVAVVYGEGPEHTSAAWQTSLDALASYASRLLETITAFKTATLLVRRD